MKKKIEKGIITEYTSNKTEATREAVIYSQLGYYTKVRGRKVYISKQNFKIFLFFSFFPSKTKLEDLP